MEKFIPVLSSYLQKISNIISNPRGEYDNNRIVARANKYFRKASEHNRKAAKIIDRYETLVRKADIQNAQLKASQAENSLSEINNPY